MAYTFEQGCYLHVPKCAGRSIVEAMALSQSNGYEKPHDGHGHDLPSRWDYPLIFTVLREPSQWLRSFWGHRNNGRWSNDVSSTPYTTLSNMVQPYATEDFDKFIWDVTANLPGLVGWFFGMYTPPPVKVVRLEDASAFLKELGADLDAVERMGVREDLPPITEETRNLVICAEVATYIRYGWKTRNV